MAHLRSSDVPARWGGDDFVLLLCDTPLAAAAELLERVRSTVAAQVLPHGVDRSRMTASIGGAQHQRGESLGETLERADHALYGAKARGRNCVVRADLPALRPASPAQGGGNGPVPFFLCAPRLCTAPSEGARSGMKGRHRGAAKLHRTPRSDADWTRTHVSVGMGWRDAGIPSNPWSLSLRGASRPANQAAPQKELVLD